MEQRDRALADKQEHEEVIAPGISIGSNLKRLSERRTDIFGVGAEETQIGKKVRFATLWKDTSRWLFMVNLALECA